MRYTVLLLMLVVAACSSNTTPLTSCRGSFQPANPGKWTPAPADLTKSGNK